MCIRYLRFAIHVFSWWFPSHQEHHSLSLTISPVRSPTWTLDVPVARNKLHLVISRDLPWPLRGAKWWYFHCTTHLHCKKTKNVSEEGYLSLIPLVIITADIWVSNTLPRVRITNNHSFMFTFKPSSPRNSGNFPRKSAYHFPSTSRLRKMQMNETTLKPPLDASEAKLHHFNSPMVRKHPLPNHQVGNSDLFQHENIARDWQHCWCLGTVGILSMTYHHPHSDNAKLGVPVPWVWDKHTQIEGKVVKPTKYITVWMLGWEILPTDTYCSAYLCLE